ncbi:hypothetical protein AAE02nite_34320 [Adhaeribacter aerolatus]|uniref:Uncharacterized protein n=1 Tax=Adhaeribacter aerolatus TaxID=670289 RepID=A0A512B1C7_9BACT|nr:hypothetical protein [Adhaeribacter aerolatus]GEO05768.1 hypothetical protein AAE02nite_34320 [Adhaeribacter aerolatus]
MKVSQGEPLNAKDKFSFDLPPIQSPEDWEALLDKTGWCSSYQKANFGKHLPMKNTAIINEIFTALLSIPTTTWDKLSC